MSDEVTRAVIDRHLEAWRRGDVPALIADFTEDAVMMSAQGGALKGGQEIGVMFGEVFESVFRPDDTTLEIGAVVVSGDHALVHWTATTSTVRTVGGFDTFVLRDGKIAAQCSGAEIVPLT